MHHRTETGLQTVILLAVAGMAGAASFTHVHDWTMHNSPAATSDWFGWANAMVSELVPIAAGLEARRRRRRGGKAGPYPVALIIGAVALSLTGQLGEAKPGLSGAIVAAVPALGFLALVKLVLSRPATEAEPAAETEPQPAAETEPEFDAEAEPGFAAKTSTVTDPKAAPKAAPAPVTLAVTKSVVTRAKIAEIAAEMPAATPAQIAAAAGVSESTARRYLPPRQSTVASGFPARVNGHRPAHAYDGAL